MTQSRQGTHLFAKVLDCKKNQNWVIISIMKKIIIASTIFMAFSLASIASLANDFTKPYIGYWPEFQAALKNSDYDVIVSHTNFPFKVRGEMDDSEVNTYDEKGFREILPKLLSYDTGLSATPQTQSDYLLTHQADDALTESHFSEEFRMGNFVFCTDDTQNPSRYKICRAYFEE
jgi:hypothetical protein